MGQEDDELLLDWSGEMRSTECGDPVTNGLEVIPVLPSRFGVNVTAVYDSGYFPYAVPLNFGHHYVCENGMDHHEEANTYDSGPKIQWTDNGDLLIYFNSTDGSGYFAFYKSINVKMAMK